MAGVPMRRYDGGSRALSMLCQMALPKSNPARRYYRAAKQRYEDAELLLNSARTTGAVYLAGYTVECFLKALILDSVGARLRAELLKQFRGNQAHDLEWLATMYRLHGKATVPSDVKQHLVRVASRSTDLRYAARMLKTEEAEEFMESVEDISTWADGRL
jgi:HEPN domain-containing protein